MSGPFEFRRRGASVLWVSAALVAGWGLAVSGARGFDAFIDRVERPKAELAAEAAKWECVASTVQRLARPGEVLNVGGLDRGYVQPRVIESVYPQVDLVGSGGTATLIVELATPGAIGDICGDLVLRIER